eukprot:43693-Pleurochrysis_carterae.AAC.1
MAEPAGGRASAMFSPPTIPLNTKARIRGRDGESSGRADGQGRQGAPRRGGGFASGPPTRPSRGLQEGWAPG